MVFALKNFTMFLMELVFKKQECESSNERGLFNFSAIPHYQRLFQVQKEYIVIKAFSMC